MKRNLTNNVTCGDWICATLVCNGRRLASVEGTQFSGLDAVKRALVDIAGQFVGMAVLTVLNRTQGWRDVTALASMRRQAAPAVAATAPVSGSGQYTIPWAS